MTAHDRRKFASIEEALEFAPAYKAAFADQRATFGQVFYTRYALRPARKGYADSTADELAALAFLYWPVRDLFEQTNGRIQEEYWCGELEGAAVFTVKDPDAGTGAAFHAIVNWEQADTQFVEQMVALDELELATHFLPDDRTRTRSVKLIFDPYSSALDAIDARRAQKLQDQKAELRLIIEQVDLARRFFKAAGHRYAQREYLRGLVLGFVPILAVVSIAATFFWVIGLGSADTGPRLVTWSLAGAVGALLSVLVRIARDDLALNWEASSDELRTAGSVRPLVGAVLGPAIPIALIGGIGTTTEFSDSADLRSQFLYLGLALVAGFSERWAPDLLAKQPAVLGLDHGDAGKERSS